MNRSVIEATLAEICLLVTDGTHDSPKIRESGVPFIKGKHISSGRIDFENCDFISEADHNDCIRRVKPQGGDILMSNIGSIGDTAWVPDNVEFSIKNVALLRPDPERVDNRYLFLLFKNPAFLKEVLNLKAGAAQQYISLAALRGHEVSIIKDLPTQTRIASILSAYDDLIENNRRRVALLEQAARLLYREWFVHFRFPGHETTPFVDGLPEGWRYARVGDLGSVVTGKTPSKKVAANFEGNIPFIKTPDMHGNVFVLSSDETLTEQGAKTQPNKTIPAGSILVSCIGTVGVVAMTSCEAQFNQQINAVVPAAGISRIFCFYVLSALKPRLDAIGGGATMANVNKSKFENLEILMPSEAVHQAFEETVRPIFDQIFALMRQNAKLTRARDLLLPRLMDGRIPV